MPITARSTLHRYGGAALVVVLATAARMALHPTLGNRQPFVTLVLAVICTAWYGGLGPSLLALVLGAVAGTCFLLAPPAQPGIVTFADLLGVGLYLMVGTAVVLFGEAGRAARRRLESEVAERRRAEEQLRDSERRFARFMQHLPGLAWIKDRQGRYVYANDAAERAFRTPKADLYGKADEEIFPPATAAQFREHDLRAREAGAGLLMVEALEHEDGVLHRSLVSKFPMPAPDGEDGLIGGIAIDITDRIRAEEALRDSEDRFRTMAESIPQLAWMARPDGHIYWYNRRWYDYTGTKTEQMEGWGWQRVHDPDALPDVLDRWKGSIASGEPFDMVLPLRGADGRFRPFLTRVMPVRDEAGAVAHWFGTNTDISDRLRIEEELRAAKDEAEEANRAKTQFLAVLSHELRTPLNPILLAATALLERAADPEEIRPTLEMIRQNVNLQARLIDDLLDVMRIVRGKMPLHWEVADGHQLIDQAIQICRSEVFGGALRLELDLAARRHHINADPARWQQVLWNLIKNAVKFTPEGGTITIRTRDEGGREGREHRLVVEVSDTGIGIAPGVLPRIFDPFQQGETTITRKFGGLGLGLAISRGIVEGHGGTLVAESAGEGRGTTFRVELPSLPSMLPEADGRPPGGAFKEGEMPARRILVVEDEPTTLRLMEKLLKRLGHEVTAAATITAAMERVGEREFDLIVSDIGLPDGTGLELMRRIVARHGPIPAIALTGYGMEDDIQRSREAGFTAHMTKPIDFTKLEVLIRRLSQDEPARRRGE